MEPKLSVGATLGEAFAIYREKAGTLIPVAFWIFLVGSGIELLAGEAVGLVLLSTLVSSALGAAYVGIVVSLVRDDRAGRRETPLGELVRGLLPVLPALLGVFFLSVLGILVGWIFLFVPGLYLLTIWAVVLQVVVVERRGVSETFGRSRQLVRRNGWRVFALILLALVIMIGATVALAALVLSTIEGELVRIVLLTIASAVIAPFSALITTVLYFRLLEIERQRPEPEPEAAAADLPPRLPT
jgi:hypothetical protein